MELEEESKNQENGAASSPFVRFADVMPLERMVTLKVVIIGAGGIGLPSALALAKSGVGRIQIWDFDKVGTENMGTQMHSAEFLGRPKVHSARRLLRQQAPWCEVDGVNKIYEGESLDADVVIPALDSLHARSVVWEAVRNAEKKPLLLVDARMGAETLSLRSVVPGEDDSWYTPTLSLETMKESCTAKATFYTGLVAGAMVAQAVKAFMIGERHRLEYVIDMRNMCFYSNREKW